MKRVCIVGGGNWGTTIAKTIAENISSKPEFNSTVMLWCYEEMIGTRKIADCINEDKTNKKYLCDVKLPPNIFATSETKIIEECDVLIFALPYQFVKSVTKDMKTKKGAAMISLTKGFVDNECMTASEYISSKFNTECGVLMGANIANEISTGVLATSTLACAKNEEIFLQLLKNDKFFVTHKTNVKGAEYCGALKNIVAIAYGIACGLNSGENTKAAILGTGIKEMKGFLEINNIDIQILFESCGIPDLIVTCMAGRNCLYGKKLVSKDTDYKLCQGVGTAEAIYNHLSEMGRISEFVLFETVHFICIGKKEAVDILKCVH